jgi:hypothetical protein
MFKIYSHFLIFSTITLAILSAVSPVNSFGQDWTDMNRVKAKYRVTKPSITAKAGEKITLEIEVEPFAEWYIYSVKERNGVPATMMLLDMTVADHLDPTNENPPPTESYDEAYDDEAYKHHKTVTFSQVIHLKKKLKKGKYPVEVTLGIQTCNTATGQCVKDEIPIKYELVVK